MRINKIRYLICLAYGNGSYVEESERNLTIAFLEKINSYKNSYTMESTSLSFDQPVSIE